jgi:hypothetical protein
MINLVPPPSIALHRVAAKGDAVAHAAVGLGTGIPSSALLPAASEHRRANAALLGRHGFPPKA